jgi:hypothetical protein
MITRRSWLATSATLLAPSSAFLASCATPVFVDAPRNSTSPPSAKIGDEWVYAESNRYNDLQTAVVTQKVVGVDPIIRISHRAKSGDVTTDRPEEIYDSLWSIKQEPAYGNVQIFERPLPFLPDGMLAGTRKVFQTAYKIDGVNKLFYWRSHLFAAGWERMKVPAGEFTALRIERSSWFAHPDSFRSDNVRRDIIWYAPAVNRWVRREWTGEFRSPGARRVPMREDWVRWDLLSYKRASA